MKSHLEYEIDDALKRILRHSGITPSRQLLDHLGQLINWIIETEQAKASFAHGDEPLPMISLLGGMGIYGAEYIDKVLVDD